MVGQQPQGVGFAQRHERHARAGAADEQAVDDLGERALGRRAVCRDDEHRLAQCTARKVVQQTQRCVIAFMHVVDDEEQPVAGRREAQQFGRGDEQPLM